MNTTMRKQVTTLVWIGPLEKRVETTVFICKSGSFVTVDGVTYDVIFTGVWRTPRKG